MKRIINYRILFAFLSILNISFSLLSSTGDNKLTTEQWREDISYLFHQMNMVHVNPYHNTSKEEFEAIFKNLYDRIPAMSDNEIFTELNRITGMINDGHTSVNVFDMHNAENDNHLVKPFELSYFPLRLYFFPEGIYITNASDEYKELIGKKVIKIGNTPIGEVLEKIEPLVPKDNEYTLKSIAPYYLTISELLNGLGIIKNIENADLTLDDNNGNQSVVNVKSLPKAKSFKYIFRPLITESSPLYLQNYEKKYWFKYLEDSKTLYINYKMVLIDDEESLIQFCKNIEELTLNKEIEKTVVDIRNNGGGNLTTCFPLVNLITNNAKINQKGKLFVIIGRQTFSAASYFLTKLEFNTKAIFAGEPSGAKPNHYGDPNAVTLPNSKIEIRLSSKFWQNSFPLDKRTATEPQLKFILSSKDYFSGIDPVLDAILKYEYKPLETVNNVNKNIIGSYIYSPMQQLDVTENSGILDMASIQYDFFGKKVSGKKIFSGKNISYISTRLYPATENTFNTDINGLTISYSTNQLIFKFYDNKWAINKITENNKLPMDLLNDGNYSKIIDMIKSERNNEANGGYTEEIINDMGYNLLLNNKIDGAIAMFKLNTELYPDSFNTYDSLGEAYMTAGNNKEAIENYKKSVELNPDNNNGKKMLEKLMK